MKKKQLKFLSLAMALGMTFGATACGGKDSEQTLDVYVLVHGYGKLWLDSALERFQNTDWVKEKYPQLKVNYQFDANDMMAAQKLQAGASINKFDLLFSVNLQEYTDGGYLADLTDLVYNAEVPGESGVKVKDKIPQRVLDKAKNFTDSKYYVLDYVQGMYGMLYNATILKNLNLEVPLTTDQFLETAATIKSTGYTDGFGERQTKVIMNNADDNYWRTSFDVWWAQYESVSGYEDYFRGYDAAEEKTGSITVLDQEGRLESLKVVESILSNYNNATQNGDFMRTQVSFLAGEGVFHYNGDYFAGEMQADIDVLKEDGIAYDIKYMKMPIISAIRKKTPSIKSDKALQDVIKEIDADKSYEESTAKNNGVSEDDYKKIVEARGVAGYSAVGSNEAVIPGYATGKEIAADFLRFMYTDESIKDFTLSSGGLLFPSTYSIVDDNEVMEKVNPISKSMYDILKGTSICSFKYLPAAGGTLLGRGGLTSLKFDGKFEVYFNQGDATKNAEAILKAEKNRWAGSAWDQMVAAAGL